MRWSLMLVSIASLSLGGCARFTSNPADLDGGAREASVPAPDGSHSDGSGDAASSPDLADGSALADAPRDLPADQPQLPDLPPMPDLLPILDLPSTPDLPTTPDLPPIPDVGGGDGGYPPLLCSWATQQPTLLSVTNLTQVNSSSREQDPYVSLDGKTLWFSSERSGKGDIYVSERPSPGLGFGAPALLSAVNTVSSEYRFEAYDKGTWALLNTNRPGGAGDFDIYEGKMGATGVYTWALLSVSTTGREFDSHLTRGGLELWFSRILASKSTVWVSTRPSLGAPFVAPKQPAALIVGDQQAGATLSRDGTVLVMASCGASGCDLVYSVRSQTGTFITPKPIASSLTADVNTGDFEGEPFLSANGCELLFARGTANNNWDLFVATFSP
jgi:hypothetical protein